MAQTTETILDQQAFARGVQNPMVDPTLGGQFGWSNNIGEFVSNAAYVRRNLVCVLLEAPRFFQLMPEPQKWVDTLKTLIELQAKTVDGFQSTLSVEFDEHAVGGAGEFQQEVTDVKRGRTEPVFTYTEKYGRPIQTFIQNWIQYGMMDPDTKYALMGTLNGVKADNMLPDWYTCTVLAFEPDPSHTKIVKSYVTTNMMPKGTGEIIGKRDLTSATETLELSIEFTGITQSTLGTNLFAQKILDSINIANANPYLRPSFIQDIDSEVAAGTKGYKASVEDLGTSAVAGPGNV